MGITCILEDRRIKVIERISSKGFKLDYKWSPKEPESFQEEIRDS